MVLPSKPTIQQKLVDSLLILSYFAVIYNHTTSHLVDILGLVSLRVGSAAEANIAKF